jgi:magnesium-transporting ATPase (P-type)
MNEKFDLKNRDTILRLITLSVVIMELFIFACTLVYQLDDKNHIETPITEEMAKLYIDHPEKLKANERIAVSTRNSMYNNQQIYLLLSDETIVNPFPWKGWILISIGAPIGIFFLATLITKAYFQAIEPDFKEDEDNANQWIGALNRLSKINVIWFMLLLVCALFLVWYIPEVVKFAGSITTAWLAKFWWIPTLLFGIVFLTIIWWIYLQYRLKVNVMHMEMEKFKLLQYEEKKALLLPESAASQIQLTE